MNTLPGYEDEGRGGSLLGLVRNEQGGVSNRIERRKTHGGPVVKKTIAFVEAANGLPMSRFIVP